ncbi:MAG: hypothetical protein COB14_02155 [Alphaproteobacteria bacterium]|nr:MAG: hypothetical protein COB14_02155 [Alphaproteobacteria bacterium]
MAQSDMYHTPILLYLVCAISAMSFVVSAYLWLWRVYKGGAAVSGKGFEFSIWYRQALCFVFAMILSILIGLYDFYIYAQPLKIYGEIFILLAFCVLPYALGKGGRVRHMFCAVGDMLWLGVLCVLGWLTTIGFGLIVLELFKLVSVMERMELDVSVVFFSGLLWNVPVLWMYYKVLYNSKARGALQGRGFYKFLWPILFAYMIILTPLVIQDFSNSDAWREMNRAKPMRRV